MKVTMATLCLITYLLSASAQGIKEISSDNDISFPSELYVLSGVPSKIYVQPFLRRWKPYNNRVMVSGHGIRRTDETCSVIETQKSTTIKISLYNTENFLLLKSVMSDVKVANPYIGTKEVTVQIIGDSYTHGAFFKDALLDKKYVHNIKMVGLRSVNGYENQYDEGRGGWTLSKYFNVVAPNRNAPDLDCYNGFIQPEGTYRYWGTTDFWKLAIAHATSPIVNPQTGNKWTFAESYMSCRYDSACRRYNEKTGLLLSPNDGDIMYDNDRNFFVVYKNKRWVKCLYTDFKWSFQYGKYLKMWNISSPKFLFVLLGLNDFRDKYDSLDLKSWNSEMETMKNSYYEAVPNGKFAICIPCSSCGTINNESGNFTDKQNAAMWEVRKNIIDTFDCRQSEGFYIVDTALPIDNVNGYKYKDGMQIGNPHPYLSYPDMGIPVAAFIQYYRNQ
jgi:hypothetical protein